MPSFAVKRKTSCLCTKKGRTWMLFGKNRKPNHDASECMVFFGPNMFHPEKELRAFIFYAIVWPMLRWVAIPSERWTVFFRERERSCALTPTGITYAPFCRLFNDLSAMNRFVRLNCCRRIPSRKFEQYSVRKPLYRLRVFFQLI